MLYRIRDNDRICITQPTHAWVSGQMAQVWGNGEFGLPTPYEAVCLGAEQHDIGWLPWEAAPTLNPETGYPHKFTEVAPAIHTKLWAGAKQLAMPMGRYVALLVSLHGTGLYERFTHWKQSPEATRVVVAFLQQEKQFQQALINRLSEDPAYAPYVTPAIVARNQKLVATLDALSLMICMGFMGERQFEHVPTASGETTLTLRRLNAESTSEGMIDNPIQLTIEPWCFQTDEVSVVFEGRILKEQSTDEQTMRDHLLNAPWVTLTAILRPR